MRLTSLLIERYGSFESTKLTFDPRPGRINLVVAPNGAGKSVLRQAFHDLLYGIPVQSEMKFRFDYAGMNLHAEAVAPDGTPLAFGWKRRGGRVFEPATEHASALLMEQLHAAVSPRQLEHLFALDTARLRRGGEDLAEGGDTLGVALLSGTGELAPARRLRQDLAARAGAVPLTKARRGLADAAKAVRSAVQQPRHRETQEAALAEQRQRAADETAKHQAARETAQRLARIDRTRQALLDRQGATAWLTENPDAPVLPPGLDERLVEARRVLSVAEAQHAEARRSLGVAEEQTPPALDQAALDEAPALAQIADAIEVRRKEASDVVGLRAQWQEQRATIARLLQEIGVSAAADQAGAHIPPAAAQAAARALITQHAVLLDAHAKAQTRQATAAQALEEDAPPDAAPDPPRVEAVQALLRQARAGQDPARQAEEAARALHTRSAAATSALAQVPGWQGDIAGLRSATPLTDAAYDRLDDARTRAAAALRDAAGQRTALQAQRAEMEQALGALRERPLPDAAALAEARAARDAGWRLVHRRAFTPDPPDAEAERAYAGAEPLALAFERHLRAADTIADQRITELARVQDAERLARDLARSEPAWLAAQAAEATAEAALAAAEQGWAAACAPLRLQPGATRREVQGVLAARDKAILAAEAADVAHAAQADILAGQAALAAQLATPLGADPALGLPALLARADMLLERAQTAEKAAIARRATRTGLEKTLRTARRDSESAAADMAAWQTQWDAALQALGRPPGEMPAATDSVLDRLTTLALHDQEAKSLTARIGQIGENLRLFADSVQALSDRLSMPAESDIFAAAAALLRRRDAAVTSQARWQQAQKDLAQRRTALQAAEAASRAAQQDLAGIVAACGAADPAEAERRLAAAQARRRAETLHEAAETTLRQQGDGLPIATLQAQADAVPPEQMAAARAAADAALDAALAASTQAAVERDRLQTQFDADAMTTQAADAADAQAQAATTFGRLLDEALVLRLAASLLSKGIQQIEQSAGQTGLGRIATAFAAVTNDAYTILGDEDETGETVLRAIETRFPTEKKRVGRPRERADGAERRAELSDGTRDQLYLALRLVALEDHAAAAPAPPFIADDILQTFDDDRALAAFHALLRLSEHVQVIVLTHHQHLVELAQRLLAGSVHCQAL